MKKIQSKKIKTAIIISVQILIVIMCIIGGSKEEKSYTFERDSITSNDLYLENFLDTGESGYYIDSSVEAKADFAVTNAFDLKPGQYDIIMHYDTDGEKQNYLFSAVNADFRELLGNYYKDLPINKNSYTSEFWTFRTLKDFEIRFNYSGDGYLFVSKAEIIENRSWYFALALFVVVISLIFDFLFICADKIKEVCEWGKNTTEKKTIIAGLSIIIFFTCLPLFSPYLFNGHDLGFHLLRIEGIKEGLLGGQFPVRIQPTWMNGYGYGVSLFYGDIFLYFPALLRIVGFSVQSSYKVFVFFINIITVLTSYYCFQRFFQNYKWGLMATFLYTTSVYRLGCIYVRASVGEYTALIFLPLIVTAITEILWYSDEQKKKGSWLLGALGYGGLILTHVITCEITVIMTAIVCLICWKRTFTKKNLLEFLKMGLGILAFSAWFLIPFLAMFGEGYGFNKNAVDSYIQTSGTFVSQLFNLFPQASNRSLEYSVIDGIGTGGEFSFALGGGYVAAIICFILFYINCKDKNDSDAKQGKIFMFMGIALVFMTTIYFPWNSLARMSEISYFLIKNIQFSWRLLSLVTIFLSFASCMVARLIRKRHIEYGNMTVMLILIFAVISSGYLIGDRVNDNYTVCIKNKDDLNTFDFMGGEYIPEATTQIDVMNDAQVVGAEGVIIDEVGRKYQRFQINCTNTSENKSYIDIPLLYYKGYAASDGGEDFEVTGNDNGCVRIWLPPMFSGNVVLDYEETWYWRLAGILSLIGTIGIFGYQKRHLQ